MLARDPSAEGCEKYFTVNKNVVLEEAHEQIFLQNVQHTSVGEDLPFLSFYDETYVNLSISINSDFQLFSLV